MLENDERMDPHHAGMAELADALDLGFRTQLAAIVIPKSKSFSSKGLTNRLTRSRLHLHHYFEASAATIW